MAVAEVQDERIGLVKQIFFDRKCSYFPANSGLTSCNVFFSLKIIDSDYPTTIPKPVVIKFQAEKTVFTFFGADSAITVYCFDSIFVSGVSLYPRFIFSN